MKEEMNEKEIVKINTALIVFRNTLLVLLIVLAFLCGHFLGIYQNKPETTWFLDSNSIQFKRSIQVDGNLYVKGKIYQYKEK